MLMKEAQVVPVEKVCSYILAQLKRDAERVIGEKISECVITVPAYFNDSQRQATRDAGIMAGFNVLSCINEPTAAAIAFAWSVMGPAGSRKRGREVGEKTVLVFDFGGGTLDVTVLIVNGDCFTVKATAGDGQLGGADIDNRLVAYCVDIFSRQHAGVVVDASGMHRLRISCEVAKRSLSVMQEAAIHVVNLAGGFDFSTSVTLSRCVSVVCLSLSQCPPPVSHAELLLLCCCRFNNMNRDIYKRCMVVVEDGLRRANIRPDDVSVLPPRS